jgi:hypothetical protein
VADNATILDAFREHLIAATLARRPSQSTPAAHPAYIEPPEGAVAPGDKAGVEADAALVLSLFMGGDIPGAGFENVVSRRAVVDVHYRAASAAAVRELMALDASIRALLLNPTNYGLGFTMGTATPVFVRQAHVWAGLGPIERGAGIGYRYVAKYALDVAA